MKEKYLVINAGSSTLKFSLYEIEDGKEIEIMKGLIERIGVDGACKLVSNNNKIIEQISVPNHETAVRLMRDKLIQYEFISDLKEIKGVGHRVVHGSEYFSDAVILDKNVVDTIKSLEPLAPNHIPGEIAGIESMINILPEATHVAEFDTAFHQSMDIVNYIKTIPYEYYEKYGIRNFGFHGMSHRYIATQFPYSRIISAHLGNGTSISPIDCGISKGNTMGYTPNAGTMMGTRSGEIEPAIIETICKNDNISLEECSTILNKKSGLLGISGISSDIRDLLEAEKKGDKRAALAIRKFELSVAENIAASMVKLPEVDAIVFTAGIGENVPSIRENIIKHLSVFGIKINKELNDKTASFKERKEGIISTPDSTIAVFTKLTNEEIIILRDTVKLTKANKNIKIKTLK